jgi:hypothetical protein
MFRDDFLVAGRIRLGSLLDLVAMYLDTLETHFDLFGDVVVEPDLLPGETDPDALTLDPFNAAPLPAGNTVTAVGQDDADDADSEDVEALRKALLEVRNAVALDQR